MKPRSARASSPRRRAGALCLVFAAWLVGTVQPVGAQGVHEDLYFNIVREGSEIGTHTVRFYPNGDDLQVEIFATIKVGIGGVTLYRRTERRVEEWEEGRLVSFTAETDDDGRVYNVEAVLDGTSLKVTGSAGTTSAPPDIMPATYWNVDTTEQTQLIDTKTGRILNFSIAEGEPVVIDAGGREIDAVPYTLSGDEELVLMYDTNGKWVGLRLEGRDGSVIEFVPRP